MNKYQGFIDWHKALRRKKTKKKAAAQNFKKSVKINSNENFYFLTSWQK